MNIIGIPALGRLRTSSGLSWQTVTAPQLAMHLRQRLIAQGRPEAGVPDGLFTVMLGYQKMAKADQHASALRLAEIRRSFVAKKQAALAAADAARSRSRQRAEDAGAAHLEALLAAIAEVEALIEAAYSKFDYDRAVELLLILADLIEQLNSHLRA